MADLCGVSSIGRASVLQTGGYRFESYTPHHLLFIIYPSSSIGRNTPAGVMRVRCPSWIYTNNVAPDVKQGLKTYLSMLKTGMYW